LHYTFITDCTHDMKRIIYFFILLLAVAFARCTTNLPESSYEIKNEVLTKTFVFSKETAGPIKVKIVDAKGNKRASTENSPYFEFVINHELITANDPLWVLNSSSIRSMRNGGTEHQLTFRGSRQIEGLEIMLYQQSFPGSTLIREKLELHATIENTFQLNKLNDKLHFKFPQISLPLNGSEASSTEIKLASWEHKPITFHESGNEPKGNHMFYPVITDSEISTKPRNVKGPINIIEAGNNSWITAYEHASQDDTRGLFKKQQVEGNNIVDAMQGVKGVFNFQSKDEDFKFLGISYVQSDGTVDVSVDVIRGGYLEGEQITIDKPYASVWTASAFYDGTNLEDGKSIIRNYLLNEICENPASRKPEFYYNTWGMQREISRGKPHLLRGCFTYETIFKEIDRAAQLGVDLFVLDDGWEQTQGIWKPHKDRLPEGLAPIRAKLDEHDMKMGIWLSPMGIDSTTQRYRQHQDWVIRDSEGNPILAQWNHPAFDFVGPFFDVFIEDCKWLIDQGARFFKWDAINTFYSTLPNLDHGSDQYSPEEIRARYEYLLPIYVTRAMEILTKYEPELVIEMDITEARRVMMGLAPLSQGKLFFMNNGASWYNDYTEFRTMSIRSIPNEYNGLIPLELFTFATYPHNLEGKLNYNVNTSLIAGHGFWGNLALMTDEERLSVGNKVKKSKKVLPYLAEVNALVEGKVGDSPEVYIQINEEAAAGQVFVFADEDISVKRTVKVNEHQFLTVLHQAYFVENGLVNIDLKLKGSASTSEAFILPNDNTGISVVSSTMPLDNAELDHGSLVLTTDGPGELVIHWSRKNGVPTVSGVDAANVTMSDVDDVIKIIIKAPQGEGILTIKTQ